MSEKNLCGKTRPIDNPYEVWRSYDGSWTWKVLKKYQKPSKEAENPMAVWFCAVQSPYTYGSYDMGDVYVTDIVLHAEKINIEYGEQVN